MTQRLLFGQCFALVVLFVDIGESWVKLFDTELEAVEFGLNWLKSERPESFEWHEIDGSIEDQWERVNEVLGFSEHVFVEPVEVVPRAGVVPRVGVFAEV